MKNINFELNLQSTKRLTRWHIFVFTFILIFFLTIFQKVYPSFRINSPIRQNSENNVLNSVLPKLQKIPNDFKIKKETSIIESTYASEDFDNASSYIAIDYDTGEVIAEKNMNKKLKVASLTKIMSSVVSLDLTNPNDQITISQNASAQEPTKIGVVAGQKMTVKELLNAALLTSANDAIQALADGINYKYGANVFVGAMNKKASVIGLSDSNFSNPEGYDLGKNYSSAEDIAIAARYALKNYPVIRDIVKKDYEFLPASVNHKQFDLYNWNGLLDVYPGVEGMKIGNTDQAGFTTVVVSKRDTKKIIAVLLGAPGILERDIWTSELLDYAFQKSANLPPVSISENQLKEKYSTWKYWN